MTKETNQQHSAIQEASRVIRDAIHANPDLAWTWHCNLTRPVSDCLNVGHKKANEAGAQLMRHLFDIDITQHPHYQDFEKQWALDGQQSINGIIKTLVAEQTSLVGKIAGADNNFGPHSVKPYNALMCLAERVTRGMPRSASIIDAAIAQELTRFGITGITPSALPR